MIPLANLHGRILPLADVQVSVLDRGFLFGDAVYEVLRVYAGRPFLEADHFARLERSLASLRIGPVDVAELRRRMHATIQAGGFSDAVVYLQVTRGSAPRRHAFPAAATPFELLWVEEYDDSACQRERAAGVRLITHPDQRWGRCDIKSVNLLANVLANQTAREAGCAEALLYLPDGTLTEASHSSFFWVVDGALHTTPHDANILPGITRALVLRLADRAAVPVREAYLRRDDLARIDELFLTGTTSEVLPVVQVDEQKIGDGRRGPVTGRLQAAYREIVQEFLRC